MKYENMSSRELLELYVLAPTQEIQTEVGKVLGNRTMR